MFKNCGQDLQWEPVNGNMGIPDHPNRAPNCGEISFNTIDLYIVGRSAMGYKSVPRFQTLCRSKSNRDLEDEFSKVDIISHTHTPSKRGIWIQYLSECAHQLFDTGFATQRGVRHTG